MSFQCPNQEVRLREGSDLSKATFGGSKPVLGVLRLSQSSPGGMGTSCLRHGRWAGAIMGSIVCPKCLLLLLNLKKFFFLKISPIHETHRKRQRQKQAPHKEPDVGLDPRTRGSCPEPKADAQPLSHPGIPAYHLIPYGI